MTPLPLAKYAADLASLPGDAALGYRQDGVRGVWEAVATRTVHRLIRASRLTVFAQTLERIPEVPPPPGRQHRAASGRRGPGAGSDRR